MFDRQKLPGYFAVGAAIGIVVWWLVELTVGGAAGRVSTREWFHVAAEALTAATLLMAGSRLLQDKPGARRLYLFASGMLVYATVSGAGTFTPNGQWAMVGVALASAAAAVYFALQVARGILPESR